MHFPFLPLNAEKLIAGQKLPSCGPERVINSEERTEIELSLYIFDESREIGSCCLL